MNSAGFKQVRFPDSTSFIWILLILSAFIFIKKSYSQVTGSSVEGPATLGRGGLEIAAIGGTASPSGLTSKYYPANFGVKAGAGLTDHIDLKVYFFRNIRQEINDGFNVVQIIPKIGSEKGRISLYLPVGIWQELLVGEEETVSNQKLFFFSPRINSDIIKKERFDLCSGAYVVIIPGKILHINPFFGITTGLGYISASLDWFFRTELGIEIQSLSRGQPSYNIGFTVGYNIFSKKGKYRDISAKHDRFYTSISSISTLSSGHTSLSKK
jgi:hypothetical protein